MRVSRLSLAYDGTDVHSEYGGMDVRHIACLLSVEYAWMKTDVPKRVLAVMCCIGGMKYGMAGSVRM